MKLVESILNEAKDLTVYKNLVTRLADYSQEYPATGVDKLFDQAVEGGLKIIPKDKKALEILGFVITNLSNPPKVVQDLLNLRFSDLPILLKPLYKGKNGRKEVASFIGANKKDDASYFSRQGLIMAISAGLITGIVGFIAAPDLLVFMKASPEVVGLGIPYLRIFFVIIIILFVNEAMGSIFRASGDTTSPTIAFASGTALNIALDPILIFGWGPFPAMGVSGAATATGISVFLTLIIYILLILKRRLDFSLAGLHRTRPNLSSAAS